ncbi:MAG: hypothetical protein WAV52_13000 [Luteococcus japonicus]
MRSTRRPSRPQATAPALATDQPSKKKGNHCHVGREKSSESLAK